MLTVDYMDDRELYRLLDTLSLVPYAAAERHAVDMDLLLPDGFLPLPLQFASMESGSLWVFHEASGRNFIIAKHEDGPALVYSLMVGHGEGEWEEGPTLPSLEEAVGAMVGMAP